MGRLFWKFFLSILLAQLAATLGIGSTFWLLDQTRQRPPPPALEAGPPAVMMIDAAAATLKHGGTAALRDMVADMKCNALIVLDPSGRDVLGRTVSPQLRAEVERERTSNGPRQAVRTLIANDGQRYLAFVPRDCMRGGHGRGPERGPEGRPGQGPGDGPVARVGGRGPLPGPPPVFGRHIGARAPIIAATLASLLFAALLAWYFSRPIRALRSAFAAASAGDLAPRFTGATGARGDDLNDLGRDFDRMSAQLRALMDGQRRLLHDVSHELRSPLARLQAAIGLAHQQPEKIATSLARIERESERMDKLVGELLTLSRLEASPNISMSEPVDIGEMVCQIADDARFEAGQDGARIAVDGTIDAAVRGAPDLLWRAIENVVRNAIKHGGGVADIRLRSDPQLVHIDVLDRGPGIAEADLPAIFEPFFRSHPTHNNLDGHGLGLAIAQRVVHAHGGAIAAANREGGGLAVTISLPLAR